MQMDDAVPTTPIVNYVDKSYTWIAPRFIYEGRNQQTDALRPKRTETRRPAKMVRRRDHDGGRHWIGGNIIFHSIQ